MRVRAPLRGLRFCARLHLVTNMGRRSNKRAVNRRARQKKSPNGNGFSRQKNQTMTFPVYAPIYKFKRVEQGGDYDIICDGINPTLVGINFKLNFVPNYTDFTNLFDVYKILKIIIKWTPEYTELTDAAPISNAVNVYFNSAIDLTDGSNPTSVNDLLQYSTIRSTGITKEHTRSLKPCTLMSSGMPCYCWLASDSPSIPHYGIKIAIPATGVAMRFRSTVTYIIDFASSR